MIPGFITDVLGIALLLPPTRALVRPLLVRNLGSRVVLRATRVRQPRSHAVRRRLDGARHRPAAAPVVSPVAAGTVRTLAFGELGTGVWVCVWADGETCIVVAGGADSPATVIPGAAISGSTRRRAVERDHGWSTLTATSLGDTADLAAFDGFDQLCEVTGTIRLGDGEHSLAALGRAGCAPGSISRGSTRSATSAPGSRPMTASRSPRRGPAAPGVTTAMSSPPACSARTARNRSPIPVCRAHTAPTAGCSTPGSSCGSTRRTTGSTHAGSGRRCRRGRPCRR